MAQEDIDNALRLLSAHSHDVHEAAKLRWQVTASMMGIMAAVLYVLMRREDNDYSVVVRTFGSGVALVVWLVNCRWQIMIDRRICASIRQCQFLDGVLINELFTGTGLAGYRSVRGNDVNRSTASMYGMLIASFLVLCALLMFIW